MPAATGMKRTSRIMRSNIIQISRQFDCNEQGTQSRAGSKSGGQSQLAQRKDLATKPAREV